LLPGLGMLSCPYSLHNGGWLGLIVLFSCGAIFCYTAYILARCLGSKPGTSTFQQVGALAFGRTGRIFVAAIVDLEILGTLVGFTISLRDNLVRIFPHAGVHLPWLELAPTQFLPIAGVLAVLPIIWVRDLSWLSYVSLGGIATYLIIVLGVLWAGIVDGIGFHHSIALVNPTKLAEVAGLYAFCYSGHVILPRIYSSMKDPSQYPKVAALSFSIATLIYAVVAIAGATMFGSSIQSQVTLSLPKELAVAKLVLFLMVLIPLTKYALVVNTLAVHMESLIPSPPSLSGGGGGGGGAWRSWSSVSVRSAIMAVVLLLALAVPAFETTVALIGSGISVTTCVILPAIFFVKIFGARGAPRHELTLTVIFGVAGVVLGIVGTVSSIRKLAR
ncbi:hypothetical protein SELMODRAFT_33314, partial [Selaginella moellendorffii]